MYTFFSFLFFRLRCILARFNYSFLACLFYLLFFFFFFFFAPQHKRDFCFKWKGNSRRISDDPFFLQDHQNFLRYLTFLKQAKIKKAKREKNGGGWGVEVVRHFARAKSFTKKKLFFFYLHSGGMCGFLQKKKKRLSISPLHSPFLIYTIFHYLRLPMNGVAVVPSTSLFFFILPSPLTTQWHSLGECWVWAEMPPLWVESISVGGGLGGVTRGGHCTFSGFFNSTRSAVSDPTSHYPRPPRKRPGGPKIPKIVTRSDQKMKIPKKKGVVGQGLYLAYSYF